MSDLQHAYLQAMGIDVWEERYPAAPVNEIPDVPAKPEVTLNVVEEIRAENIANEIYPSVDNTSPVNEVIKPSVNVNTLNWQQLEAAASQCQLCDLATTRQRVIFAAGHQAAPLMILGDAPSREDEQHGQPFSGEAGNLLTAMIKAMGYQRNQVYISNLVKCVLTENQDPSVEHVISCEPYLLRQIQLLQPKVILALGSVTAQRLLKTKSNMNRLRGQLHYIDGINVPVVVSYEPGYLLRSPNEKRKAWEDLQLAMNALATPNT